MHQRAARKVFEQRQPVFDIIADKLDEIALESDERGVVMEEGLVRICPCDPYPPFERRRGQCDVVNGLGGGLGTKAIEALQLGLQKAGAENVVGPQLYQQRVRL